MKARFWMWMCLTIYLSACGSDDDPFDPVVDPDTGNDVGTPHSDAGDDAGPEPGEDAGHDSGSPDAGGSEPDVGEPAEDIRPAFRAVLTPAETGTFRVDAIANDVNDSGVLVGEATLRGTRGFSNRLVAFRFTEAEGFVDLSEGMLRSAANAVNDSGTIAGTLKVGLNDVAFLHDDNGIVRVGEQLTTAADTRGYRINASGQLGGTCVVDSAEYPCRYTPGSGWLVLEDLGTGNVLTDDGSLGGVGRTASRAYMWSDATGLRDVGLPDQHKSMVTAISPSGRWMGTVRFVSKFLYPAQSYLIDANGGPARLLGDGDGRPRRELAAQVSDVNDDGWAVGNSYNERGDSVGMLWSPWSGIAYRLDDLVALEEGQTIVEARGISASGYIAATVFQAGRKYAALLVPTQWPSAPGEISFVESDAHVARWVELTPGPQASHALGIREDGALLFVAEDYDNSVNAAYERYGWRLENGTTTLHGERGGDLPVTTSPTGRLVGTARVLEEFTDVTRYYAASASNDDGLVHVQTHPSSLDSFGYAISEGDEIAGECLGDDGFFACYYNPATLWQRLFVGWASDISDDGVVIGNTEDGPVEWVNGTLESYQLGPDARVLAISGNSVWVVGNRPDGAFLLDRRTGAIAELPAMSRGADRSVEPRFVGDDGIVVGTARRADGVPVAFRWSGGDEQLTVLVDPDGLHHVLSAEMINARGQIAVTATDGAGLFKAGVLEPSER